MMMGWGGVFFGTLMMIGFIALIVFAAVVLFRVLSGCDLRHSDSDDSSLGNLKMQFAAGDIDPSEYEDRRHQMRA